MNQIDIIVIIIIIKKLLESISLRKLPLNSIIQVVCMLTRLRVNCVLKDLVKKRDA
jgi:hypothetical protein